MKTNKKWYPYEDLGSYLKLEDGVLMGCAMNTNGSREENPCEVESWDWDDLGTHQSMQDVIQELQSKE